MSTETPSDVVRIEMVMQMNSFADTTVREELEIPRSEWDAMDDDARDAYMDAEVLEFIGDQVSAGWTEVEDGA